MTPNRLPRTIKTTVLALAVLSLAGGLTGCRPGNELVAGTTTESQTTSSASSAASVTSTPPTSSSAPTSSSTTSTPTTQGSVTVSITAPVSISGTVKTTVACVTGRAAYRADVSTAVVQGNQVTFGVSIAGYRGPGSYPAIVNVTLRQSSGTVTTLAGVAQVPAVITSTGGSFSVTATGSEGRSFSGSMSWVCGS